MTIKMKGLNSPNSPTPNQIRDVHVHSGRSCV